MDELAPRDEVARAIHEQLRESGEQAVLLDMRAVDRPSASPTSSRRWRGPGSTRNAT